MKFRVIQRPVFAGKDQGKTMQFGMALTNEKISFKRLCHFISSGSTLTSADVRAVFDRFVEVSREFLREGHSIEVDGLGTFSLAVGSEGVDLSEEFRPTKHLRNPRIVFRAKPEFKTLDGIRYERISPEEEEMRNLSTAKKKIKKSGTKPKPSVSTKPSEGAEPSDSGRTGL